MVGKARVHELAKELGVTSKEILAALNGQGVFVKSASSTVEAPVARRLRASYANKHPRRSQRRVGDVRRTNGTGRTPRPSAISDSRGSPLGHLTASQAATVRQAYREAYVAENPSDAINEVYLKYEALYQVSRTALRKVAAEDRRRHAADYAKLRKLHDKEYEAKQQQKNQEQHTTGKAVGVGVCESTTKPPDASMSAFTRPRNRLAGLPSVAANVSLEAVADVILSKDVSQRDRQEVIASLVAFDPTRIDGYGYLAWRYSVHRRRRLELPSKTVNDDLAAIAQIVDAERQLLGEIVSDHGAFLDHPTLAKRALESEFHDLIDSEDIGRSAPDELRHVRANTHFLRRAVVLTIACPDCDERLWEMLGRIQPPTRSQLVEITPSLITAIDRLNDQISEVEALLSADTAALGRFFQRSRSELGALQAGQFDYLRKFHDVGSSSSGSPRQVIHGLPFAVLPQGEQLRTFLDGLRSSGLYRGYDVDPSRLTVLEDLEEYFGADRCDWYEGSESSRGVNNQYLVLAIRPKKRFVAIRSKKRSGENAVAISPLAGQHATYVVRHECAEEHWASIFAKPKFEARLVGARKLLFTAPDRRIDQYTAMRDKVITLLECDPRDFQKQLVFDENSDRYRMA